MQVFYENIRAQNQIDDGGDTSDDVRSFPGLSEKLLPVGFGEFYNVMNYYNFSSSLWLFVFLIFMYKSLQK